MKNLHTLDDYRLKDFEMKFFGTTGDEGNGVFKVFVQGRSFFAIATSEAGWEHVSVSRKNRCPTWEEMCAVKDMFFEKEECAIQYHPRESEYVNNHPYCLHIWRPIGIAIPEPPSYLVGVKGITM